MSIEEILREELISGALPPGSKINISELKKRHQTSLAPLREALSFLAATGLLRSEPNRGFFVTPVSEAEITDLYETSAHLEALALNQAIKNASSQWEEEIVAALYHLKKVELSLEKPSYDTWVEANQRFHDALIATCSVVVKELRCHLHLKMSRYVRLTYGKAIVDIAQFHQEHQALADAVIKRDCKQASKLMDAHIMGSCRLLLQHFKKNQEIQ